MNDTDTIDRYLETGKHLGIFSSEAAATAYAKTASKSQEANYPEANAQAEQQPTALQRSVQEVQNAIQRLPGNPIEEPGMLDPEGPIIEPEMLDPDGPPLGSAGDRRLVPDKPLTVTHLMSLVTSKQKSAILEMQKRVLKPGIDQRPASTAEFQDLLLETYGPILGNEGFTPSQTAETISSMLNALLPARLGYQGGSNKKPRS